MTDGYDPGPGDIGMVRMRGWGGKAIRIGQWLNGDGFENYQHAYVVTEKRRVIEAMPGGAILSPLSKYDGLHPVYLRCPDEYRSAVASAAMALRDVPYSDADYVALAAHRFHIPAPHLKRYISSSGHLICSQLADHAAAIGGWHLFADQRWEGDVTPLDLVRLYHQQAYAAK